MNPDEIRLAIVVAWGVSAVTGMQIGGQKQASLGGLLLGAFFGPIGMLAAGFLDGRPKCSNCGGRHNGTDDKPYPVCQHCGNKMLASESLADPAAEEAVYQAAARKLAVAKRANRSFLQDAD